MFRTISGFPFDRWAISVTAARNDGQRAATKRALSRVCTNSNIHGHAALSLVACPRFNTVYESTHCREITPHTQHHQSGSGFAICLLFREINAYHTSKPWPTGCLPFRHNNVSSQVPSLIPDVESVAVSTGVNLRRQRHHE